MSDLPAPYEPGKNPIDPHTAGEYGRLRPDVDEDEGGGGGLARIRSAIWRCRWIVLVVTVVGNVAGFAYVRTMPLQYMAEATLWVTGKMDSGPLASNDLYLSTTAWIDLLRSSRVLDHVVRQERLFLDPAAVAKSPLMTGFELADSFAPGEYRLRTLAAGSQYLLSRREGETEVEVERGPVGGAIGNSVGFVWAPAVEHLPGDSAITFAITPPAAVARGLSANLDASVTRKDGNFIRIQLTGMDPHRTADAVNAIAYRSAAVTAEIKRIQVDDVTDALTEQLIIAEQRLREAEITLESFRVQTATLPSADPVPMAPAQQGMPAAPPQGLSRYLDLTAQRGKLTQEREAVELFLRQLAGSSPEAPIPALAVTDAGAPLVEAAKELTAKQAALRGLREDFTDQYPAVQTALEELRTAHSRTIPSVGQAVIRRLQEAERDLTTDIDATEKDLRDIPPRTIEEGRLERSVSIADNLHSTLKQRFEQSRLTSASSVADLVPLDLATVPRRPIEDKRLFMMLIVFGGSLGISVAGAVVFDRLDPRVRYPDQITHGLGLVILGAVPHVRSEGARGAEENAAMVGESFREMCFNVLHSCGAARPLVVTVSSPEPGDGKSFVATNLALGFARRGNRTLLIDGDMRRATVHRLLGLERTPGLADYLSGDAMYEEILRFGERGTPTTIPAGRPASDAPELLNSRRMGELMARIRAEFDVIIFDSPPLAAGVDPYLLATLSGEMLLVLRTGNTNQALTEAKFAVLDRLPVRLIGAVLNDVPPNENIYRHYSYLASYSGVGQDAEDAVTIG